MENSLTFGILGLVAIVAIVGMLTMFTGGDDVAPSTVILSEESGNTAGMAYSRTASTFSSSSREVTADQLIEICDAAGLDAMNSEELDDCLTFAASQGYTPSASVGCWLCQASCRIMGGIPMCSFNMDGSYSGCACSGSDVGDLQY